MFGDACKPHFRRVVATVFQTLRLCLYVNLYVPVTIKMLGHILNTQLIVQKS